MSTQMAVLTGSSMSMAQTRPGVGKSAPGFGAEMQHALASTAAGPPLPQDAAGAGQAVVVPEGAIGEGQLEGFAGVNDLLATLGAASPMAASPAAASSAVAGQPVMPGVQSFLTGTMVNAPRPGAAQAASRTQAAAETQAAASAGTGSSAPGTATGVPALPAPAAAAAAEPESPTAALLAQGAQQGAAPGGHAGSGRAASGAAGIPAPAAGVSAPADAETHATGTTATGMTAAQAQKGSFGAHGAAPNGPVGDAQPDVSPAQLFAVAAGQQPAAASPAQPAPAALPAPPASPPLATQLQGPLFSLASAKPGEHTMTLSVTPDNLGPVTVRAQIGAEGLRVELFAPTDAGREALRAILQDLKRDLASAGLGADLDLSSQNQPDEPGEDGPDRRGNAANQDGTTGRQLRGPGHHAGQYLRIGGSETGLDVLA